MYENRYDHGAYEGIYLLLKIMIRHAKIHERWKQSKYTVRSTLPRFGNLREYWF
jgi:hypothetical protein